MNRPEQFSRASALHAKAQKLERRPSFECIALLLQGGGALGACQGGVYQALAEENLHPD
jgi:NTE family protein